MEIGTFLLGKFLCPSPHFVCNSDEKRSVFTPLQRQIGMISQFLLIIPMSTVDKRIWTSDPSLRRRMLYPAELCRHTIFGLKSRFFSLFDHPDRWPIFSIFSRYFFRRKCYLRPLQHLAFLIKILSTEFPSTPEYFSKVLSTGPPLGGACFIR